MSSSSTDANTKKGSAIKKKTEPLSPSQIVAWGSTTGKLYLDDDPKPNDPNPGVGLWEYIVGKGSDKGGGDKKDVLPDAGEGVDGEQASTPGKDKPRYFPGGGGGGLLGA